MNGIRANFKDGVIEDGYMWVFDNCLQAVCKINPETMVMDMVEQYEGEENITIGWIVAYQNKLFMVKTEKPGILIYDRNKKRFFERFDAPNVGAAKQNVASVLLYENTIWIFPVWLENAACCYDLKRGKYYTDHNITRLLKSHENSSGVFSPFYYIENEFLWLVSFGGNAYWKYNLKENTAEKFEFDDQNIQLSAIFCVEDEFFFSFIDSAKIVCNSKLEVFDVYSGDNNSSRAFSNIVRNGKKIVFLPRYGNKIVTVDILTKMVSTFALGEEKFSRIERIRNFCRSTEGLLLIPYQGNEMYIIRELDGTIEKVNLTASFNYIVETVKTEMNRRGCVQESKNATISGFIQYCAGVTIDNKQK